MAELEELVAGAVAADPRAVARLITMVESTPPQARRMRELAAALTAAATPHAATTELIGVTGPPGVGKSTLVAALVRTYRERGARIGVLAVDPTSPFTGGALLGDRVRMQDLATDPGVFIRSMATRGHLGGLAVATPQAVRVLQAAGCDVVLLETVGVGQSEVEVAGQADTTLVLLAPGLGDAVQVAKAGVLEIGDILVVNKADRDGADRVVRDLRQMVALGPGAVRRDDPARASDTWVPPIVRTVAEGAADGISELVEAIAQHRSHLQGGDELVRRRKARVRQEIEGLALDAVRTRIRTAPGDEELEGLVDQVLSGRLDPYRAADTLVAHTAEPNQATGGCDSDVRRLPGVAPGAYSSS